MNSAIQEPAAAGVALPKSYIRTPQRVHLTALQKAMHAFLGLLMTPLYLLLAAWHGGPGLRYRWKCLRLGLRLLVGARAQYPLRDKLRLMYMPMDSTRHFEFEYLDRALARKPLARVLDVSSPRLVPVILTLERPQLSTVLINPDEKDLAATARLVDAAGLRGRCMLSSDLIADVDLPAESFDAITCVSVLEHIPADREAVQQMWRLLKPGGVLVLTVPCMARAMEQYIDVDEYGILRADDQGFFFWQRYYDERLLEERIFSATGRPRALTIFGEKTNGSFARNAHAKRRGGRYPFWREAYMMAREYGSFERFEQLPGEGVVGMIFVKP